ncbi:leucyl aminopeptidase [Denitrobaculum tricleocarpae]|uniref:Probable cytosol aminopeptidase n=1 Tax=Denitrobaculum tricleocarpae TaxID=2591009 RepID=A0A545TTW6_9PROT|nr:leucyl aminopeptidase [Denitrobaculum tricleocarpae]TQV80670.1 leucyl aminopeptidase [Denitrobaculum tricleocarpae]
MKISFAAPALPKSAAIVTGVMKGGKLSPTAAQLDKSTGGAVSKAIKANAYSGKKGEMLEVLAPANIANSRILLAGLGDPAEMTDRDLENLGGSIYKHLVSVGEKEAAVIIDSVAGGALDPTERAAHSAYGALLRSYRFDKYKTKEKPEKKPKLSKLTYMVESAPKARKIFGTLSKIADGVFMTRDLVSEPANILYPKTLAQQAKELTSLGVKVQVLGEKEMTKLGMGALLGVGQGSERESQLLVMRWDGAPKAKDKRPVAFVGKGVTFDTGGISIKPAAGMEDMKWDMGGSGVVVGLMKALAGRKAKTNVVAVCGLVENMPSGNAQRPGDIVTSMSGQTIEVLNTDAEGRLVLADALWYTQEKFKPRMVIDLATLTGAIIIALGNSHAGVFSNDDDLAESLGKAGKSVGENVWRMPLSEDYDKLIDCDAADMKNIGGRGAGSITAAQFLQRFIQKDVPWAHIDIAGVTWSSKDAPTVPRGATAFGVRLLDRLVADHYEG